MTAALSATDKSASLGMSVIEHDRPNRQPGVPRRGTGQPHMIDHAEPVRRDDDELQRPPREQRVERHALCDRNKQAARPFDDQRVGVGLRRADSNIERIEVEHHAGATRRNERSERISERQRCEQ